MRAYMAFFTLARVRPSISSFSFTNTTRSSRGSSGSRSAPLSTTSRRMGRFLNTKGRFT